MTVRVFSSKLNFLAMYASRVASLDKGMLKVFLRQLSLVITKDVIIRDNPPKSLSKALGKTLRYEVMR